MDKRKNSTVKTVKRFETRLDRGPGGIRLRLIAEGDQRHEPVPARFVRVEPALGPAGHQRPHPDGVLFGKKMIGEGRPGPFELRWRHPRFEVELTEKLRHPGSFRRSRHRGPFYGAGGAWQDGRATP